MIPLYDPSFLRLYTIDALNLGIWDLFTVIGLWVLFGIYIILSGNIFPTRYIQLMKRQAARDVQKSKIKREYINDFEKII